MPDSLDATVVRTWCELALEALGRAREGIDAINVYPVADGDTGTNLYFTVESAAQAVDAVFAAHAAMAPGRPAGGTGRPGDGGDGGIGGDAGAAGSAGAPAPVLSVPLTPALPDVLRAMAHGALIGARGNSGTILAQLLRGMTEVLAEEPGVGEGDGGEAGAVSGADTGERLRLALRRASDAAYQAVARPVEGTVLTVAAAAADAAEGAGGSAAEVARAAYGGACAALDATPGQLAVLGRAGVVDAGGCGLVAVLGCLVQALTGATPAPRPAAGRGRPRAAGGHAPGHPAPGPAAAPAPGPVSGPPAPGRGFDGPDSAAAPGPAAGPPPGSGDAATGAPVHPARERGEGPGTPEPSGDVPAFEVIYLLDADDDAVRTLRARLDALGDSLVVVGGDGLWNVHVHVDDAGAAVEAGIEAGRPHRVRITHFGAQGDRSAQGAGGADHPESEGSAARAERLERAQRAVVAVVPGDGLAALCREAGATVVTVRPGEPPAAGELVEAVRRAGAREVVLLPNDAALRHQAAAAAEQARAEGVRVALIPTRSAVQGIAALAVHEPARRFDEDVVAMTSAAGATRYAELAVAEHRSWTMAGVCQAGDVLGLIDGDVAVIGQDLGATAEAVLDRMLAAGGEMVTLVLGSDVPDALADRLEGRVRDGHLAVDTVVYRGGQPSVPLIIGVE